MIVNSDDSGIEQRLCKIRHICPDCAHLLKGIRSPWHYRDRNGGARQGYVMIHKLVRNWNKIW